MTLVNHKIEMAAAYPVTPAHVPYALGQCVPDCANSLPTCLCFPLHGLLLLQLLSGCGSSSVFSLKPLPLMWFNTPKPVVWITAEAAWVLGHHWSPLLWDFVRHALDRACVIRLSHPSFWFCINFLCALWLIYICWSVIQLANHCLPPCPVCS